MAISKQPEEQSSAPVPGGEIKHGGEQEEIQPLSLATPDLTPREYRLIAEALELERVKNHPTQVAADASVIERNLELLRAQIDRMFAEDPRMRNAEASLPKEMMPVPPAAINRTVLVKKLSESFQYVELYLSWLNNIIPDSAIAMFFGTGQLSLHAAELYGRFKYLMQFFSTQQYREAMTKNDCIDALAEMIFLKIELLRELHVDEEKLSEAAFEQWLQSKRRPLP